MLTLKISIRVLFQSCGATPGYPALKDEACAPSA